MHQRRMPEPTLLFVLCTAAPDGLRLQLSSCVIMLNPHFRRLWRPNLESLGRNLAAPQSFPPHTSCQGKAKTAEDPMLALRIVLIVLGVLILIGENARILCGWYKIKWRFPEMKAQPKLSIQIGFSIINNPFSGSDSGVSVN